jgi:hypothetical protein
MRWRALVAVIAAMGTAAAQPPTLQKMEREGAPVVDLSPAERNALADPLFEFVLKMRPTEASLDEIEKLLQPAASKRLFFVVHEQIVDPTPGQSRRAVIGFGGTNPLTGAILTPNVMLSVIFDSEQVLPGFIEAWGWDGAHGRYNYYRLDQQPHETAPTWKFRGASVDADVQSPAQRAGTCLLCHRNGGPVMKELLLPWNNWNSFKSPTSYLRPSAGNSWPIASTPRLAQLAGAERMEVEFIVPALNQFNARRLNALLRMSADGSIAVVNDLEEVIDGPRLLRPLFETTEFNIISSDQRSGLHPTLTGSGPASDIPVPDSFFLNANLIGGRELGEIAGLGIEQAHQFSAIARVSPTEYRELVATSGVRLGNVAGDANFGWLVPEPSHIDVDMVDLLIRRGVITPQFAAAVLAVDLETPLFSPRTKVLQSLVPQTFRFRPVATGGSPNSHPDELTAKVIGALEGKTLAPASPEADFLALLQSADPIQALRDRVRAYHDRIEQHLGDAGTRKVELQRLYQVAIDRRRAVLKDPTFQVLDETEGRRGLFPLPPE